MPRKGDHKRVRACAEDQFVIRQHVAVFCCDGLGGAINRGDAFAETAGDVVFSVPVGGMGFDLFICLVARKDGGEHDAVIVPARLCVEERDIDVRACVKKLFQHAPGGHAGTDDD